MSTGEILSLMRGGITEIITLIAPCLIAALVIGLVVAIFQAVTSIQEQTLTFLPKFLTILIVLALLGGFMFSSMSEYTIQLFSRIPDVAR